jgi:DNA recombination protein RmuC
MVEHCDFSEQTVSDDRKRPDLVVRLPRGQIIAIDATAPTDAFREAAVAADPAIRTAKLAEHAAKVRGHIDALAARAYWEQFTPSPEFVVLFLPATSFSPPRSEADPAIVDRWHQQPRAPRHASTLVALLKAAAYGWRQEAVVAKTRGHRPARPRALRPRRDLREHLEKPAAASKQATAAFNKAVGSFEGTLLPGARKFVELGARGTKELPELGGVETTVRDLARRS